MGRTFHLITCTVYLNFKVFTEIKMPLKKSERHFLFYDPSVGGGAGGGF
jgi:hypothetical protein